MRISYWSSDVCSSDLLPSPFTATRYHSLVVQDISPELIVNATSNDTMVMGFRHSSLPIHGVQFHPESIATEHGHAMLANFMKIAGMKITRSEEYTSELQSLMRISYAVVYLTKKNKTN